MPFSNQSDFAESFTRKYKLCVSDFDGVQGFTEKLQMEAYLRILEKYAKIKLDLNDIVSELIGKTATDNLKNLKEKYKIIAEVSELLEERENIYLDSVFRTALQPNKLIVDLCKAFSISGDLKPIIVSNSNQHVILNILKY